MSSDIAVKVESLSKCYHIYDKPQDRLKQSMYPKFQNLIGKSSKQYFREFWALRDITFEIKKGEAVGIIGRNGSGKSTLLQLICGTLNPTSGRIKANGRIAALLELGSGFNPEFTGKENVYMNGQILGFNQKEIEARYHNILEFADIGKFINQPVKSYSSGMMMRLAFAVQVLSEPEILIIDEALSVGDFFFQQKCLNHIRQLCAKGTTLLFVSHDMQTVRDLCDKGLFLENGELSFFGNNLTTINYYLNSLSEKTDILINDDMCIDISMPTTKNEELYVPLWKNYSPTSNSILEVGVYNSKGEAISGIRMGEELNIKVRYSDVGNSHVMLVLHNRNNQVVTSQGTYTHQFVLRPKSNDKCVYEIQFCVTCNLEAGEYSLTFYLSESYDLNVGKVKFETPRLGPISVIWNYTLDRAPFLGLFGVPISIKYVEID